MLRRLFLRVNTLAGSVLFPVLTSFFLMMLPAYSQSTGDATTNGDPIAANAVDLVTQGREVFRFDTFGDQAFWGDTLRLHQAIEGAAFGGVGPGLSPKSALALGLKVDATALPQSLLNQLRTGQVNLNDPAITVQLLRLNAIVGLTGMFNPSGTLQSIGIQCSLCHSTVDNSDPTLCAGAIKPNPAPVAWATASTAGPIVI